jgi:CRP/FNR family transcriptional regulator, anaerobic regulatory protein
MNPEGLFTTLEAFHPLRDEFKKALEMELIPLSLPKNHVLLEAPKISTHAYFLDKGFALSYSFYQGKKITENFWKSGQIMVAFESFFEQTPSLEFIQLMQASDVLCISYDSVQKMFDLFPEAQRIYRGIMNRHYAQSRGRIRDIQRLSASQRLEKLVSAFPDIELIVSQDAIASYLGITPQSLARIKRKE